jgi:phage terminase large subunit
MGRTRAVCIREVQNSIKDSVKQLLTDKIRSFALQASFEILETEIRGPHGSLIVFKGMQSYNADNIKSLEAYDIAWVEEAQTLSQHSLDLLRPTLRKEGSEIWCSWNPRYKTDPVDMFFRKKPPAEAVSVFVNWKDNPWFPNVLYKEMLHDFEADPDKAEHIWNGAYGAGQGAILARWVNKAEREGRINDNVRFDPYGAPVEISSDIGFRDTASWWFWQRKVGGFSLFRYEGDSGLHAPDWCKRLSEALEEMGIGRAQLGKIWLPPDAKAETFQSQHTTIEQFISFFGVDKIGIVPGSSKLDQINAAREVIDRCEFNRTLCEAGLDGLSSWEYKWIEEGNVFSRVPVHNHASHPSDAYSYGCQVMQGLPVPEVKTQPGPLQPEAATMEELWAQHETARAGERRI